LLPALLAAASLVGCGRPGGVVGGALGPTAGGAPGPVTSATPTTPGDPATVPNLVPTPSGPTVPALPASSTAAPSTAAPATTSATLRLGGDDLGVTRVGEPFRTAVDAVTAQLGKPRGDPAPDSACVGAEEETSWAGFRLAGSAGKVSGWLSTSPGLATPAGATVGTPVTALRQAYGAALVVQAAVDAESVPVFAVGAARLGGTLTDPGPNGTVSSIFNGTCQSA
ncbi:MAG: hypothetical protein ABIS47_14225, partial [Acidimicrobiales bacterium]